MSALKNLKDNKGAIGWPSSINAKIWRIYRERDIERYIYVYIYRYRYRYRYIDIDIDKDIDIDIDTDMYI